MNDNSHPHWVSTVELRLQRRRFLAAVTALGLATSLEGRAAESLRPRWIIDTHTHFYDPTRPGGVPWPSPKDPLLFQKTLPENYPHQGLPHPVHGTVVVEASRLLEDNQWILDLAASRPFIVGFVGNLKPGHVGFRPAWERFSRNPLFRGIRIRAQDLEASMEDSAYLKDLELLAQAGQSVDVLGAHKHLPSVASVASRVPGIQWVLDHFMGLRWDGSSLDADWLEHQEQVAKVPGVNAKVSGLVEATGRREGDAPADWQYYRSVLDAAVRVFGRDRLIYGSNWPVSARFAPLAVVQGIVSGYFASLGQQALDQVFWQNARRVYGWLDR